MSLWLSWLRVVIVTAALVPFVYWATRAWAGRSGSVVGGTHLQMLESLQLSQDVRIAIVRIAGLVCVVSISGQGVQVLQEITDPQTVAELDKQAEARATTLGGTTMTGGLQPFLTLVWGALTKLFQKVEQAVGWLSRHDEAVSRETPASPPEAPVLSASTLLGSSLQSQIERLRKLEVASGDEAVVLHSR